MTRQRLRLAPLLMAFAGPLTIAAPALAAKVDVDLTACRGMYDLMRTMRSGAAHDSVKATLDGLLETRPYRVMFSHYNRSWRPNHLPPAVFERMILSLEFPDEYTTGENQRADAMLPRWRQAYDDLPTYERKLARLEAVDLPSLIDQGVKYAQTWLPKGWRIPDFPLIVLPQGGSPAFSIDGAQGYDFLQLPTSANGDPDVDWLVGTIAHESNHLGMQANAIEVHTDSDTVALKLVGMTVAEGVATEFISGPPAGCVPALPGRPFHIFTPDLVTAWNVRVPEEPQMVDRLTHLLDRAIHGDLTQDQLDQEMRDYWFDGAIGRAYVLGSEFFGAIDLALGRKAVFEAIKDPRQMFRLYNQALDHKPDLFRSCVRMPETAVSQALAIGEARAPT